MQCESLDTNSRAVPQLAQAQICTRPFLGLLKVTHSWVWSSLITTTPVSRNTNHTLALLTEFSYSLALPISVKPFCDIQLMRIFYHWPLCQLLANRIEWYVTQYTFNPSMKHLCKLPNLQMSVNGAALRLANIYAATGISSQPIFFIPCNSLDFISQLTRCARGSFAIPQWVQALIRTLPLRGLLNVTQICFSFIMIVPTLVLYFVLINCRFKYAITINQQLDITLNWLAEFTLLIKFTND